MTLTEMHVMFRQYAQQMGMQNVRAILPEQIDLLLNTSISDTINQIIRENIGVTNDRVVTDNSKIGQINALSTLYTVQKFPASGNTKDSSAGNFNVYTIDLDNIKNTPSGVATAIKYLFIVDLSIDYTYPVGSETKNTNLFPVRIIDDTYLADTLNDFILSPRVRTPIAVMVNKKIELYVDLALGNAQATPKDLRLSYIAAPAKVAYLQDVGGTNTECNLPDYLHIDIVKHAVDLYRVATSGALHASQQNAQAQQQEAARNQYRNEGNPQTQQ